MVVESMVPTTTTGVLLTENKCGSDADVADLDCWLDGDSLKCAVVVVGMELVTIDLPSYQLMFV